MTRPSNDGTLAPTRRRRAQIGSPGAAVAPTEADFEDAEIARGQSAAVLGALARMQLRLDVLARQQTDTFARVLELLEEINEKLTYEEELEEEPRHELPSI